MKKSVFEGRNSVTLAELATVNPRAAERCTNQRHPKWTDWASLDGTIVQSSSNNNGPAGFIRVTDYA